VTLVAFITAMLCGILFAVLVDVRKGRLLERWQIERLLDRPILGEIALPGERERA
jgi:capsular polysaccharide biosynthesis protein